VPRFVSSAEHPPADLAKMVGNISLVYEATGAAKISFDVLSVLGSTLSFFSPVSGSNGTVEIDAEQIMRNLVLNNQVICGTVNAGRASFEEGVQDLVSFMRRFPDAVRALITARMALDDARDAVLSRGGIKSVITGSVRCFGKEGMMASPLDRRFGDAKNRHGHLAGRSAGPGARPSKSNTKGEE